MGRSSKQQQLLHAVPPPPPPPAPPADAPAAASPLTGEPMDVTPELAARWLEKNHPSNRPIAWGRVEAFANDMRAGAWKLTHQGICFDGEGYLIDGQHRLKAVVAAKVTVRMVVFHNAQGTFHDPIDRMGPRSVGTILGISWRDAACLNTLRMMEAGYALHHPLTVNEAAGIRERHLEPLTVAATIPGRSKLTGPVNAAIVWALPVHRERTIDFAVKIASGEMIGRGHPAFAYRSWHLRNERMKGWEQALAALNCLRFHVNDVPLVNVTIGELGFRGFCARRRAMKVPNTPSVDVVPAANWVPWRDKSGGGSGSEE